MIDWSFETAVRTLWQEARGEPRAGREAVAHVLWNRLRSARWGNTMACVCLAPLQFSGWLTHDPNRMAVAALADADPVLGELRAILAGAENAPDPTGGATHYYVASLPSPPAWARDPKLIRCGQFGRQIFFKAR
jgi:spore germination cell wall hydrolase CwlJ-like protein